MEKTFALIYILLAFVLFVGCTPNSSTSGEYQKMTAEEAKARMDSGDEIIVVDVRTAEEFESGHIEGAVLIPNESISDTQPALLSDLDAEILIYCRSGNRSAQAAKKLLAIGYTNVYDFGGIIDWPYETVTGSADTQDISDTTGILSSFTAIDVDGNTVNESILAGRKLTMVNIWATFCSPCIDEMPELGKLNAEYSDQGFQVVGIVIDTLDSSGQISTSQLMLANEIITSTSATYLHLLPSTDLITLKLNQVTAVPETFFVDENGNQIGESYLGSRSKNEWAVIIEDLLSEVN